MSDGRHPDLEAFYDSIAEEIEDDDEFHTGELEVFENEYGMWTNEGDVMLHDMDVEEEYDEDEDEDEFLDPEDDDEDEDDDDDDDDDDNILGVTVEPGAVLVDEGEDDDEEGDDGTTFLNLAQLLNQAGASDDARSTLLRRLLAGAGPAAGTRSGGQGLLRTLGRMATGRPTLTPEEQERRYAEQRRKERGWWKEQKEPHPDGQRLLRSGEFGRVGDWRVPGSRCRPRSAVIRRKARTWSPLPAKATLPNTNGTIVAKYPSVPYVGQYAGEDYGLFYAATQNFTLHLYATGQSRADWRRSKREAGRRGLPQAAEAARRASMGQPELEEDEEDEDDYQQWGSWGMGRRAPAPEDSSLRKIKNVQGIEGSWTVTDCDATISGDRMIYSSINPFVHMIYTAEDETEHIELDFSRRRQRRSDYYGYDGFGIWSIRFSADGKEVVAGCGGGQIMTYDLEAQQRSLAISGHADDVNAVCFADESSTNILVSGSDDGYVKVWDRRSLSSNTPSGVLVGATEGITYTSPKGDGRYIVVNSKDQAARLYDLRQMRNWSDFEMEPDAVTQYGKSGFDYRTTRYPQPRYAAHPKDCSVMTFRGHTVLQTLIRCHFSPRESTGQSYIYSGSADGMIHIWSLDGRVAQVLNRARSNPLRTQSNEYSDPSAPERARSGTRVPYEGHAYTVRDVSWHGYEPTLMSTCWDVSGGYRRGGSVAKHEWKGLGKGGLNRLEDWVEKQEQEGGDVEL